MSSLRRTEGASTSGLLTVSGLPGAGTSTVAKAVAADLGLERLDGGSVFRAMAAERSMTLAAFGALAESDPAIDLDLDRRLAARAAGGGVVLESRLAGWIAHNDGLAALKVWVGCDEQVRAVRVAGRDGHDAADALRVNREREASEQQRYEAYYGIDLGDLSIYDLVLDSSIQSVAELVAEVVGRYRMTAS